MRVARAGRAGAATALLAPESVEEMQSLCTTCIPALTVLQNLPDAEGFGYHRPKMTRATMATESDSPNVIELRPEGKNIESVILPLSDSDRGRLRFRFFRCVLLEISSVLADDGDPGGSRDGVSRSLNARRTERACMATGIAVRGVGATCQAAHPQASEQISEHSCQTIFPPSPVINVGGRSDQLYFAAILSNASTLNLGGKGCSLIVSVYRLMCRLPPLFASEFRDSAGKDFGETSAVVMMMMAMVMMMMANCVLLARVATCAGRPKCVCARCTACAM